MSEITQKRVSNVYKERILSAVEDPDAVTTPRNVVDDNSTVFLCAFAKASVFRRKLLMCSERRVNLTNDPVLVRFSLAPPFVASPNNRLKTGRKSAVPR
jgi:hypothetical protein